LADVVVGMKILGLDWDGGNRRMMHSLNFGVHLPHYCYYYLTIYYYYYYYYYYLPPQLHP